MLREMKVYTIDAVSSNSMKSRNPYSGIHETNVAKCLDTMCLDPSCNQGGHMVVIALEGNGARPSHMGNGYSESETMYTLNTIEQHSVCYAMNSKQISMMTTEDMANTLAAEDYKEPQLVCYSVDCRNLCTNKEVSGTLQAKNVGGFSYNYLNPVMMEKKRMNCYPIENHPHDSRVKLCTDGIVQTLPSHMGTGGNNTPLVLLKGCDE